MVEGQHLGPKVQKSKYLVKKKPNVSEQRNLFKSKSNFSEQ